jgi:L-lactate dehydrogenase complex protein LldF
MTPRVERFARELSPLRVEAVRAATKAKTALRTTALETSLGSDWEQARGEAARIKDRVLADLPAHVDRLEAACRAKGVRVHRAASAADARKIILGLLEAAGSRGKPIVKAKSMATEEIHLNAALIDAGYDVVETDLGEFVIQLDGDTPSHIVTPLIHKNRLDVARTFSREGLGPYTEEPAELAVQARAFLRQKFREAGAGISGVNFAVAETGRIVIVENEGNNRLSTTAPKVHIALMGIEKIVPDEASLPLFLKLLAASATNQFVTTYTHFVSGPRRTDEPDGPEEVHLILLDNGRSRIVQGPYRGILRCIRCGACQNACPVYRQATGHGYGHVYAGPIGAVFAPALEGVARHGELSKASSLCGLCEEVCPVKIPIPDMLLRLRRDWMREGGEEGGLWRLFRTAAVSPFKWAWARRAASWAGAFGPFLGDWNREREAPGRVGRDFRRWWDGRKRD